MTLHIDSHQHFWELGRGDYHWLTPELEPLYRDHGPADLAPLLATAGVDATVLVQAAPTLDETRYLLGIADETDFVAGVVGWVDMEDRAAATHIAELARHPKLVGLRPMLQDIEDPTWIGRPELDAATKACIDHGLCFDALVTPIHLPCLLEYLQRHPDLKAVVDHGAKPDIASGDWEPWASTLADIAAETGASCKLSGLTTEAGPGATDEDLVPYVAHILDIFGPERLIWGSDWPVVNLASSYDDWHTMTERFLASLGTIERSRIMRDNAVRFYGLAGH